MRLRVVALQGMSTNALTGERKKVFGTTPVEVPMQLVLWKHLLDPRFTESAQLSMKQLYPPRCEVLSVAGEYLGYKGYVVYPDDGVEEEDNKHSSTVTAAAPASTESPLAMTATGSASNAAPASATLGAVTVAADKKGKKKNHASSTMLQVEFLVPTTSDPQFGHAIAQAIQEDYYSSRDVCKLLKIQPDLLGRYSESGCYHYRTATAIDNAIDDAIDTTL